MHYSSWHSDVHNTQEQDTPPSAGWHIYIHAFNRNLPPGLGLMWTFNRSTSGRQAEDSEAGEAEDRETTLLCSLLTQTKLVNYIYTITTDSTEEVWQQFTGRQDCLFSNDVLWRSETIIPAFQKSKYWGPFRHKTKSCRYKQRKQNQSLTSEIIYFIQLWWSSGFIRTTAALVQTVSLCESAVCLYVTTENIHQR